jgi:hypothetical protein
MIPELGRTRDDLVCPGKRAGSWINAYSFYQATRRRRRQFQISAASKECRDRQVIGGSIVMKRLGLKVCST